MLRVCLKGQVLGGRTSEAWVAVKKCLGLNFDSKKFENLKLQGKPQVQIWTLNLVSLIFN